MNVLPKLSIIEQTHSDQLVQVLKNNIIQADGKIPFSAFMNACLYTPGLGYYSAGAAKFGQAGDFVTAPEISALFGKALAEYYHKLNNQPARTQPLSIIEIGAGTGKLAKDILLHLKTLDTLPAHYYIVEVSADLKQKQQALLQQHLPDYIHQITWLTRIDAIPDFNGHGLVLANEVLDALPVEIFTLKPNAQSNTFDIYQRWLINHTVRPNQFEAVDLPAETLFTQKVTESLPENFIFEAPYYQSEINLNTFSWLSGIEKMITHGQFVFIDYGFGVKEYYHPSRHMGTLMCHYKHRAHGDFLLYPGLQDITSHVNFTQVALAAKQLGLTIDNFTTQAEFLLSQNLLANLNMQALSPTENIALANEIQQLTASHEMGELFKVLILQKGDMNSIISGRPHFHRL